MAESEPAIEEVLRRGTLSADEADLEALARLMLAAIVSPGQHEKLLLSPLAGRGPPSTCAPARLPTLGHCCA